MKIIFVCLLVAYCSFDASCLSNNVVDDAQIIDELRITARSVIKDLSEYKSKYQSQAKLIMKDVEDASLSKTSGIVRYVTNSIKTAVSAVSSTGKNADSCLQACKGRLKDLSQSTNKQLDKCNDNFSLYIEPVMKEIKSTMQTTNLEGGSVVEKLTFYNHTECECRERNEPDTKNEKSSETRVTRQHPTLFPPQNLRRPPQRKTCRCPSEFTPRITPGGECQCKCFENDQNCIRTRRGKVYFSIADRLCIQSGDCSTPLCEFGDYMRRQGKCPKKMDQFDTFSNYQTNLHHGFRS